LEHTLLITPGPAYDREIGNRQIPSLCQSTGAVEFTILNKRSVHCQMFATTSYVPSNHLQINFFKIKK